MPFATREITSSSLVAEKGFCPVSSAKSTEPTEKTSLRASRSSARACSGDIHAGLPLVRPMAVRAARVRARAMPKSISFTSACVEMSTLFGHTSRWTMPSGSPPSVHSCA